MHLARWLTVEQYYDALPGSEGEVDLLQRRLPMDMLNNSQVLSQLCAIAPTLITLGVLNSAIAVPLFSFILM